MKKLIIVFGFGFGLFHSHAQQITLFNNYLINPYLINPARAGANNGTNAYLLHRQQWVGITGAPITDVLTIDGLVKSEKAGLGLAISNDLTNIIGKTSAMATYAYHGKINEDNKFALGLSAGIMQTKIMFDKLVTQNFADKVLLNNIQTGTIFDANFGVTYQYKKLDVGISANQLFANKTTFTQQASFKELKIQNIRHLVATIGYTFNFKKDILTLSPVLLMRSAQGLPIQAELNTLLKYKNLLWMNLAYRYNSAVSAGFGLRVTENISASYVYEYATSNLNKFSKGSHEILLGFRFNKNKQDENANAKLGDAVLNSQMQEQYDQLQQRIEALAKEIKKNNASQQTLNDSIIKKHDEYVKLMNEIKKDKKDAISPEKDAGREDLNNVSNSEGSDHYIVIGAYNTLKHANHFQKTIEAGKGLKTEVVISQDKKFYMVWTKKVKSKEEASAELQSLKKMGIEEIINSKIWIHKQESASNLNKY